MRGSCNSTILSNPGYPDLLTEGTAAQHPRRRSDGTVPLPERAITVRDLLTFTFGFGSVMAMPGTYRIHQPIADGHLGGDGPPHIQLTPEPDEYMRRLGELPLMYQPRRALGSLSRRMRSVERSDLSRRREIARRFHAGAPFRAAWDEGHRFLCLRGSKLLHRLPTPSTASDHAFSPTASM